LPYSSPAQIPVSIPTCLPRPDRVSFLFCATLATLSRRMQQSNGDDAATIEYAVSMLGVKDIGIGGHSHCGVARSIKTSKTSCRSGLPEPCGVGASNHREKCIHITDPAERLTATVEENVLVQLEHLRTHPAVTTALSRKELNLHGCVYEFETGQVFTYHPQDSQFVPI